MNTAINSSVSVRHSLLENAVNKTRGRSDLRIVPEDPAGFKAIFPNGDFFFHLNGGYDAMPVEYLDSIGPGFPLARKYSKDLPKEAKVAVEELMDDNQRRYDDAKLKRQPYHIIRTEPIKGTGPGKWGAYHLEDVGLAARQEEIPIGEWAARHMPIITRVNGQHVLQLPLRSERPKGSVPVLESIFFGEKSNKLAEMGYDYATSGAAIVLGFDKGNEAYRAALDYSSDALAAKVRDLSALRKGDVNAVAIVNKFQLAANWVDDEVGFLLDKTGVIRPNSRTKLDYLKGGRYLVEGVGIVAFSTIFEKSVGELTAEPIAAMYRAGQFGAKRVMKELPGYENAVVLVGWNWGRPSTLAPAHVQILMFKYLDPRRPYAKIEPSKENVLYDTGSVATIAHPDSFGQVTYRFVNDKSFLDRTHSDFLDLAQAQVMHFNVLNLMGFADWTTHLRGNDFTTRILTPQEAALRIAYLEHSTGIGVNSGVMPPRIATTAPGDQQKFKRDYRDISAAFQYGRIGR